MSHIRLSPPEEFNFKCPDEWPRWKRRFEQFRVASGLGEESETKQVNTLLYCLGEESEAVLSSTNATDEDRQNHSAIIAKFDAFFRVRKNVIFERARFNRRKQLEGETAEQYIMELYRLAENCDYGEMTSEMIRDRLVVGIRDIALSERLQLDSDLTLDKAKRAVRQREAVQEQQQHLLNGEAVASNTKSLEELRGKSGKQPKVQGGTFKRKPGYNWKSQDKRPAKPCTRCGKDHARGRCPAKDAVCHRCQRKGHYSTQCFSKTVSEVSTMEPNPAFLDAVIATQETSWKESIRLNGCNIAFKLDTGAEVTAISRRTFQKLHGTKLEKPSRLLHGPSQQDLKVVGQFSGKLSCKAKYTKQLIFVIENLRTDLLGLPAITALNLVTRVQAITGDKLNLQQQFPRIFQGLGNLGQEYEIQLKPGAKPHSIYTPRRIPLPLLTKVQQELNRMEAMGVITKVDRPTP